MKRPSIINKILQLCVFPIVWITLLALTFLLVVVLLIIPFLAFDSLSLAKFNHDQWIAIEKAEDKFSCGRGSMGRDIVKNILKVGLSTSEIETVLGPATFKKAEELQYHLGLCSGFRMDYDFIHIYLDDHGRMTHAEILQH